VVIIATLKGKSGRQLRFCHLVVVFGQEWRQLRFLVNKSTSQANKSTGQANKSTGQQVNRFLVNSGDNFVIATEAKIILEN
jgi:hypothetical protein